MKDPRLTQIAQTIYASELFVGTPESGTLFEKQNIFLVCGGQKPVGFVSSSHKKDLGDGSYEYEADDTEFVSKFLSELGLFSKVFADIHTTDATISLKEEYLKQLSDNPDDHKLAGLLYGYPESAVEAFLAPNKRLLLPDEEQDKLFLAAKIPITFPNFKMSIAHYNEELLVVQRWYEFCKLYGMV